MNEMIFHSSIMLSRTVGGCLYQHASARIKHSAKNDQHFTSVIGYLLHNLFDYNRSITLVIII